MPVVIPNEGKSQWLIWLANQNTEDVLKFQMFTNDYTPVAGSVFADFTLGTFTGTSVVTYNRAALSGPTIVSDVAIYELDPPPQFERTAGGPTTFYGWVLYDEDASIALATARFAIARVMSAGSKETLDPLKIHLRSYAP